MFAVVLDTCVLWPSLQRDFLLSLAVEGLYRPLWSSVILDELNYHESQRLVDRGVPVGEAASRAEALVAQMAEHFDDARVEGWEPLEGTFHLPDPHDEHVLAAAVMGGAGAIVTENLKDFPKRAVPNHIDVVPAKQFAYETALVDPQRALAAVQQIAARWRRPRRTVDEVLDALRANYGMGEAVDLMSDVL